MKAFLHVISAFAVIVVGASLGAHMHQQVKKHDAELRTPGRIYNDSVNRKMDRCMDAENKKLRDICFVISGITI